MNKKDINKNVKEKIAQACEQVVLQGEVTKLRDQLQKQLAVAKQELARRRQEVAFWEDKINQLAGGVAACSEIAEKSQKVKKLELEGDNTKPEKK